MAAIDSSPPLSHPPTVATAQRVIGIDVGSTTVKAIVMDPYDQRVLWSDYQRHNTRQPEKVIELLTEIEKTFPDEDRHSWRVFMTGSGALPLCDCLGARFVQEVNAVMLAVESEHPDVGSVIELGGQDAKIIIFQTDAATGRKTGQASMNDKCASGTGATIDKCMIKVGLPQEACNKLRFDDARLHHVAAKCGVFAETDIVNLIKSGIPSDEVLCSLADAIVLQNLSVLTRGSTLRHRVLLLGGPNTYLPFLQDCWRKRIPETWEQRGYEWPREMPLEELIFVPENAQYYAAVGAAIYGLAEPEGVGQYRGVEGLIEYTQNGRKERLGEAAGPPLVASALEVTDFVQRYKVPTFVPPTLTPGSVVRAAIGLDGGSTSSKAVLMDESQQIIAKAYQLSKGNPIQDMKDLLTQLRAAVERQGATLEVIGFGATGYAADVLEETLQADANVVETVAHMVSAVHFFGEVDVICDIGGQDIKVLFMKHGDISSFRLSNSCSAGNGMLLQAMADQFGVPLKEYAETAFSASLAPKFSYGCAVFLDTDRVNFQKQGFSKEELLAGLAQVLPKNVWQYVVQIPRMASLGRKFVLQGGTQYNLAAVKAQVDYICERVPGAEVSVHPHTGEAGAIGAALETLRVVQRRGYHKFIGLEAAIQLDYAARNDESTRCHFCENNCSRTFIDAKRPDGSTSRYISGFSCEKGTVESESAMKALLAERKKMARQFPNVVEYESRLAFRHFYSSEPQPTHGSPTTDISVKKGFFGLRRTTYARGFQRSSERTQAALQQIRIGIPRVLNLYSTGPYFRTYLESLGIPKGNIIFSDETTEELWMEGGKYGSIDPCYPSKVAQAHVHNLLFHHHSIENPLTAIFFPILTHVPSFNAKVMDTTSCPIVAGVPEVIKAAFTKEVDFFKARNIQYLAPALTFSEPTLTAQRMFDTFGPMLGITQDENDHAHREGLRALESFDRDLQEKGRAILETVEDENRLAVLMLGRPYHSDAGLHHDIPKELQILGYPVLSIRSIPRDKAFLSRWFSDELARGQDPLEINDVWPENYSANSCQKVWAAKFAARHPNVVVLDLSSFKCGHDAPTYGLIDSILGASKTPHLTMHDIDANKPGGSLKIRIKTFHYSLTRYMERREDQHKRSLEFQKLVAAKKLELLKNRMRHTEATIVHSSGPTVPSLANLSIARDIPHGPPIEEAFVV